MKFIRDGEVKKISGRKSRMALFYCEFCGKNTIRRKQDGMKQKSCGCTIKRHGGAGTRLYEVWKMMIRRCRDGNIPTYKYYGGRGIKVCEKWRKNFANFRDWALSNGYGEGLQIDRIDNDGGYEPNNCRFVTNAENKRNQSTTKLDWDKVNKIRELYSTGEYSQVSIASMFGVTKAHICDIVKNKAWFDEKYNSPVDKQD
jgi:ribosomal protein L37AE/L43A